MQYKFCLYKQHVALLVLVSSQECTSGLHLINTDHLSYLKINISLALDTLKYNCALTRE